MHPARRIVTPRPYGLSCLPFSINPNMDLGYRIRNFTDLVNWIIHAIGPEPLLILATLGIVFSVVLCVRVVKFIVRTIGRIVRRCQQLGILVSHFLRPVAVSTIVPPSTRQLPTTPQLPATLHANRNRLRQASLPLLSPSPRLSQSTQTQLPTSYPSTTQTLSDLDNYVPLPRRRASTPLTPLDAPEAMPFHPRYNTRSKTQHT